MIHVNTRQRYLSGTLIICGTRKKTVCWAAIYTVFGHGSFNGTNWYWQFPTGDVAVRLGEDKPTEQPGLLLIVARHTRLRRNMVLWVVLRFHTFMVPYICLRLYEVVSEPRRVH